jgi:beta-lactamase class D
VYNTDRAEARFSPFSTFKVLNSLIGLETGVIQDADHVIHWDDHKYPLDDLPDDAFYDHWRQDNTLRSAIQYSVVWYYRELAIQVGAEEMQRRLDSVGYGNNDISSGIDGFWLAGSLEISAIEKVDFLRRFYLGELPFSDRSVEIVKEIILLEENQKYRLFGKTGSGFAESPGTYIGWFVGFVEVEDEVWLFATNLEGDDYSKVTAARVDITRQILPHLGILEPE